jgi:drug/metabolite transporter (DMT)-like permease
LLVNAVFATALGFVLYFRLIRMIGSLGAASVGYLKPVVGVIIGCVFLGEVFTEIIVLGLAAVLSGVMLINADPRSALCWSNLTCRAGRLQSPRPPRPLAPPPAPSRSDR